MVKKIIALGEVALVLSLFLIFRHLMKLSGFSDWQGVFGAPVVSSCLLFFVLPLVFVFISGRSPGHCGLTTTNLNYHWRVALRAIMFVAPATALFLVVGLVGSQHTEWLGGSILTAGFIVAGLFFASKSDDLGNRSEAGLPWTGLPAYLALLVFGLLLSYALHPWSELATKIVRVLIFVGFLEEFFFRGYAQSRLNDTFGKPFVFHNVEFGPGLLIAAAVFGLFHPLTVAGDTPWAWGLWTAAFALILGFLREKTGGVIAPALVHGVLLIPGVFFGSV